MRVVTVQGEMDHDVKGILYRTLLAPDGAARPSHIAWTLSVTFMDSSGINVFVTDADRPDHRPHPAARLGSGAEVVSAGSAGSKAIYGQNHARAWTW
ncbi:hypothetical protein [Streptomyces sp. NPDC057690]|uniref:hypothetical protein n=1 Tax=Streptomyces sp. NPDC057690 TaxID=3346214 RepID=UPI0036AF68FF